MQQLRNQSIPIGLKQVDVYAGLNVLILLFKLHAQAQPDSYPTIPNDVPDPAIIFHPCDTPSTETFAENRLISIIHAADSHGVGTFARTVGPHLARTDLCDTELFGIDLFGANLFCANLVHVNLVRAYLVHINLVHANLIYANLKHVNFKYAILAFTDLSYANLSRANLNSANLSSAILLNAQLENAQNLLQSQLEGSTPPLLCGTTLPADIALDPNRDCRRLPQVLVDRYPGKFKSVEAAAEYVQQQVPSAEL